MIDEAEVTRLHEVAMGYAHEAMVSSDAQTAFELNWFAFENERRAAEMLEQEKEEEPTRSILYRSAATLALDCRQYDEAERLIKIALGGFPPPDVVEELRELHKKVEIARGSDVEIRLPPIGEEIVEARVTRIFIEKGQHLEVDQIYMEVSTDKVDIEIPSPLSGLVVDIPVTVGQLISAGTALARISADESSVAAREKMDIADLRAALQYLATRDSALLCARDELGGLRFEEFRGFVEDVALTARRFEGLALENFDFSVRDELRAALFFVTSLIRELQAFNPRRLGTIASRKHTEVVLLLRDYAGDALRRFRLALRQVGRDLYITEFDPTMAYALVSYSHADANFAQGFATRLSQARIAHFLDAEMNFGKYSPLRIANTLERSSHLITLISPASAEAPWIPYKWGYARARGVRIVPYMLQDSLKVPFIGDARRLIRRGDEMRLIEELSRFRREAS